MIHLVLCVVDGNKYKCACGNKFLIHSDYKFYSNPMNTSDPGELVVWNRDKFYWYMINGMETCYECRMSPEIQMEELKRVEL